MGNPCIVIYNLANTSARINVKEAERHTHYLAHGFFTQINYDFTRIGEYKYFLDTQSQNTVVSYEYPEAFVLGKNERYYPIINEENERLYEKYLEEAKNNKKVTFLGRLGDYKYYDMDQAVARALKLAKAFC